MPEPAPAPVASPVPRAVARLIDIGVQIGVLELAGRCADFLPVRALVPLGDTALLGFDLTVGLSALVLYGALSEWFSGATLGKFCLELRVVDADSRGPVSLRAAAIRNAALPIDLLFLGLVAYSSMSRSPLRQRVGDVWADSVVIPRGAAPLGEGARGWPIGILAAVALVLGSYILA